MKKNKKKNRKKSTGKGIRPGRKAAAIRRRSARRNVAALLSALGEGAGFAVGERTISHLSRSKRKRKKKNPKAYKYAYHRGVMAKHLKGHHKKLRRFERSQQKKFGIVKGFSKERTNPAGKHAVAVGAGRRQLVFAGSKQKIQKLAGQLRAALGTSRVRTGKIGKKKVQRNPAGLVGTVGEALIFAGVFEGVDILKKKIMGEK
jgi:hypothetical protein